MKTWYSVCERINDPGLCFRQPPRVGFLYGFGRIEKYQRNKITHGALTWDYLIALFKYNGIELEDSFEDPND